MQRCCTPLPVPPPQGGRERCGTALPISSNAPACGSELCACLSPRYLALRVSPPGVERLDAARMRHGGKHIAHIGELIERAAEPQHLLGRSLIERAPRAITELGLERALRQRMIAITAKGTVHEM